MSNNTIDDNMTRVEYLESLPKDKDGNPIVDEDEMMYKSSIFWELEFLEDMGISVSDYPEYFQLP